MADIVSIILKLEQVRQFVSGADQASKAVGGVGKSAEESGKKAKVGWKGLAKFAGGAAALYGAQRYMTSAVGAAVDLGEEVNKAGVVFGKSSASLVNWSKDSATALGQTQEQALAAAGVFGNMLVPMGFARREAAGMSKNLVGLASDMASFNNASPQETLDALRSGLAGETEPLRKYGIFLSQARIQAQAMSMGLVKATKDTTAIKAAQLTSSLATAKAATELKKHGKASDEYRKAVVAAEVAEDKLGKVMQGKVPQLTAAQKAQATYGLILKDTKDAQGDFARTSGSLANRQRILRAQLGNISANVGKQLLPAIVQVAGALTSLLAILTPLTKNATVFKVVLGLLVVAFLAYKVAVIANTLATIAWNSTMLITVGIVGAVILILVALGVGFYLLYKRVDWFRAAVDATWQAVKVAAAAILGAFKTVFDWVKGNWPLLLGILTGPFGLAVVLIIRHFSQVKAFALGVFDAIRAKAAAVAGAISGIFNSMKEAIRGALNVLIQGWNSLHFKIPGFKVGPVHFGGKSIGVPPLPTLAAGGYVHGAGSVLVGEQGPEMLSLPRGASIMPLGSPEAAVAGAPAGWGASVEVPLYLDGKEVARSVARVTADKLARR